MKFQFFESKTLNAVAILLLAVTASSLVNTAESRKSSLAQSDALWKRNQEQIQKQSAQYEAPISKQSADYVPGYVQQPYGVPMDMYYPGYGYPGYGYPGYGPMFEASLYWNHPGPDHSYSHPPVPTPPVDIDHHHQDYPDHGQHQDEHHEEHHQDVQHENHQDEKHEKHHEQNQNEQQIVPLRHRVGHNRQQHSSESSHHDLDNESVHSDHSDRKSLKADDNESVHSDHSDNQSVHSDHSDNDSVHSDHSDNESVHSDHSDNESVHSDHSDNDSVHSDHSDNESVHSDHSDNESVHSDHSEKPETSHDHKDTFHDAEEHSDEEVANAFKTMGLQPNATIKDVKKAYKLLASHNHPDKNSHLSEEERHRLEEEMKKINLARDVLFWKFDHHKN